MKRVLLTCCVLTLVSLVPRPASADSILDPIIGIRGARGGSPNIGVEEPVTTGFVDCSVFFGDEMPGYVCADFNLSAEFTTGLYAVDLSFEQLVDDIFKDINNSLLVLDAELSGFTQMEKIGEFTVRLFGGAAPDGALACPSFEGPPVPCIGGSNIDPDLETSAFAARSYSPPGDDAIVFLKAICENGEPCPTDFNNYRVTSVNAQNTPVPEPGTLLLMGIGLAGLAGRRFRPRAQ